MNFLHSFCLYREELAEESRAVSLLPRNEFLFGRGANLIVYQFEVNCKDVQTFLGIADEQFKQLGGLIAVKDQTMHITSQGRAGNAYRQVEAVVVKGGGNPKILSLKE